MKNLRITIIQSPLHWENPAKNREMFSQKISSIKEKTDLIVLPETFSTGFTMNAKKVAEKMNGATMQWMRETAKEKNCVLTGSMVIEGSLPIGKGGGGGFYNRLIWMRANGTFETYDKKQLFRYADEHKFYTPGNKKLIVELNGWKICPLICYDLRFPVWCRNHIAPAPLSLRRGAGGEAYDLLLFVANWPERRSHPWKTLLLARAMENQCYVAGVNRIGNDGNNISCSGDSAVINPKGEIISKIKANEESVETISLSWKELEEWRKTFPAWRDADEFQLYR